MNSDYLVSKAKRIYQEGEEMAGFRRRREYWTGWKRKSHTCLLLQHNNLMRNSNRHIFLLTFVSPALFLIHNTPHLSFHLCLFCFIFLCSSPRYAPSVPDFLAFTVLACSLLMCTQTHFVGLLQSIVCSGSLATLFSSLPILKGLGKGNNTWEKQTVSVWERWMYMC